MAIPFMARCLSSKLNNKLNPVISNKSLAISFLCKESRELSTSTYKRGGIDAAAIAGSNMMTKMLRRQKQLIQKYEARQKDNDKRWSTKRKNNASASKLTFEDTPKTTAFNKLLNENLLLVLHSPTFHEHFKYSDLTIVKV